MSFWPLYICSCYTSVTSHDITWLSHDVTWHHMTLPLTLCSPGPARFGWWCQEWRESSICLPSVSAREGERLMSNKPLLIQRREVQKLSSELKQQGMITVPPTSICLSSSATFASLANTSFILRSGDTVTMCGCVWYQMRCTNQFGRCVHAFLSVSLSLDWSEKTEGVEELGLLEEAKRRKTQHL